MQTVQPIYEGESYASIFQKLNTLIAGYNEMVAALGSALNNGTFDYNSLSNRPSINNVLLEGNKTQDQLSISIDSETQQALTQFGTQIEGINTSLAGKVNTDDLPTVLQPYAKSTDIPDVSGLATQAALTAGLATKVDNSTRTADLAQLNTAINSKVDSGDTYTNTQVDTLLAGKQAVINDLSTIRSGAAAGATAYQKPSGGIPSSDMASAVQTSLGKADSAYQKPSGGIPKTDMASAVQTSLGKADSAYQKPSGGIPASDMTSAVQTSLGKADAAAVGSEVYNSRQIDTLMATKANTSDVYTKAQSDALLATKSNAASTPSTTDWNTLLAQMNADVTAAGNSATAAANSATSASNSATTASNKATEASQSAQSVSGAVNRISALENTVNGTGSTQGLSSRTLSLENKMGDTGDKTSISADLKETRVKSNDILEALKQVPEVYEQVKSIAALDVNY